MTQERKPDIGPKELGSTKESKFLLSREEWYAVQRYVASALRLPDTEQKMRVSLATVKDNQRVPYAGALDEFKELLAGYQKVISHAQKWSVGTPTEKAIFTKTVELAQAISNYAVKARVFYGRLTAPIEELLKNPHNKEAQDKFASICGSLAKEASDNEKGATEVYKEIAQFAKDTSNDEILIKDLEKVYDGKFGKQSAAMQAWKGEMEKLGKEIADLNKDYEHDCLVAETTPTYAWILLWVAVIVAAVYGARAADLKRRIDEKAGRVALLKEDTQRALSLLGTLSIAKDGLRNIKEQIEAALPCIQKIQGVWLALGSDLTRIGKIIKEDIVGAEALIKDLGVELAIAQWQECKEKADAYQVNAFIEVADEKQAA